MANMTWGVFVKWMEEQGVKPNYPIQYIDIGWPTEEGTELKLTLEGVDGKKEIRLY